MPGRPLQGLQNEQVQSALEDLGAILVAILAFGHDFFW